jgi:hypothetical protein
MALCYNFTRGIRRSVARCPSCATTESRQNLAGRIVPGEIHFKVVELT